MYKGRLKVILLLQVSSHDFEPTFNIFLSELKNTARPAQIKKITKPLTGNKHLSLLYFCLCAYRYIATYLCISEQIKSPEAQSMPRKPHRYCMLSNSKSQTKSFWQRFQVLKIVTPMTNCYCFPAWPTDAEIQTQHNNFLGGRDSFEFHCKANGKVLVVKSLLK